jgi:glycosyltransferase involved in cell wall biosynthesis
LKTNCETPELSVVAPLHNEEQIVRPLFEAICAALDPLGRPFEVLLVNDGSTDRTGELLDAVAAADTRLRPVHLDGNFGEAAGLCAGFETARGRIILTLDGDLLERGGYRAVSGWRRRRQEQFTTRILPSLIANRLIARVTGVPSRDNGCGLKAYRSEVVKGVYLPHGLHRFMPAVFGVRASEFAQLEVTDRARQAGRSHYGLSRFFAVVRDVLVIPYLPERVRVALRAMAVLLGRGLPGVGSALGVGALALVAYAQCVRANLKRWLHAQAHKTFRIRSADGETAVGIGTPSVASTGRARA